MRRILSLLLYLYPRKWRARYGAELLTLSEDMPVKWSDPLDLVKGALRVRTDVLRTTPGSQIVLACILMGALIGAIGTKTFRTVYVSTAVISVDGDPLIASKRVNDLYGAASTRGALTKSLTANNLYPAERAHTPLEDVIDRMRRDLRVSNVRRVGLRPVAFVVAFAYEDAATAQRVATQLVAKLIELNTQLPGPPIRIKAVQSADLPLTPVSPSVWRVVAAGATAGLLLGLLLSAWAKITRRPGHQSA